MANLLPENSRLELRREYRARYVFAGSVLGIIAAIVMFLALLPSYVMLSSTVPKGKEVGTASKEAQADFTNVTRAQALVQQFSPTLVSTSSISLAIEDALSARPKGVGIDEISYDSQDSGTIVLGGLAENRDAINAFRNGLQTVHRFTGVKLPVGDLIGTQGGRFTVTLSGKF